MIPSLNSPGQGGRAYDRDWDCGYRTADCLGRWAREHDAPFSHVYIPATAGGQCCETLLDSLRQSPQYVELYHGLGGTVFATRGRIAPPAR